MVKAIDRFWNKVKVLGHDDCWEWRGAIDGNGYGLFWYQKHQCGTHRWIYEYINKKTLPSNICVCHICDNPSCVNPWHLWEGTIEDNIKDRQQKHRQARGIVLNRAGLTQTDVLAIRADNRFQKQIAQDYGVSQPTISYIKSRKNWQHL